MNLYSSALLTKRSIVSLLLAVLWIGFARSSFAQGELSFENPWHWNLVVCGTSCSIGVQDCYGGEATVNDVEIAGNDGQYSSMAWDHTDANNCSHWTKTVNLASGLNTITVEDDQYSTPATTAVVSVQGSASGLIATTRVGRYCNQPSLGANGTRCLNFYGIHVAHTIAGIGNGNWGEALIDQGGTTIIDNTATTPWKLKNVNGCSAQIIDDVGKSTPPTTNDAGGTATLTQVVVYTDNVSIANGFNCTQSTTEVVGSTGGTIYSAVTSPVGTASNQSDPCIW
jgi:hypothetical protein